MGRLKKILFKELDRVIKEYDDWKNNQEEVVFNRETMSEYSILKRILYEAKLESAYMNWRLKKHRVL